MTSEQKKEVLDEIANLEQLNFKEKIAAQIADKDFLRAQYYEKYTLLQMSEILDIGLTRLKEALETHPEYFFVYRLRSQDYPVAHYLQHIQRYLNIEDFAHLASRIDLFVDYLNAHNLWGPNLKLIDGHFTEAKAFEIEALQRRIKTLAEAIEGKIVLTEEKKKEIDTQVKNLERLQARKERELDILTERLEFAQKQVDSISGLLNKASTNEGKIEVIETQQQEKIDKIDALLKQITAFINDNKDALNLLEDRKKSFEERLTQTKDDVEFIHKQREDALKIVTILADNATSYAFEKRVKALKWTILIWGAITALSAIGAGWWIITIFTSNGTQDGTGSDWIKLLSNILKSAPALILAFWAMRQYNRERKYLESYALKSGIALTVNTYSEKFEKEKREEMLMETIRNIYENPDRKEARDEDSLLSTKSMKTLLMEVLEVLKTVNKGK